MMKRRILVAPLDWGLGHATRCVPLIRTFLEQKHEVILTANGRAESFLRQEFPDLEFVQSPGYDIRYSKIVPMWLSMLLQAPGLVWAIYREHKWLDRIILEKGINEVLSDNRYGLWSDKIRSVFMTHQVMIKCLPRIKFLEPILHRIVLWFMKKYTECWIPDVAGKENLSGDLSHKYPLPANAKHIGWLSRFSPAARRIQNENSIERNEFTYDMCIVLSGPEPLRTELENIVRASQDSLKKKVLLIQGIPEKKNVEEPVENLRIVSHLGQEEFEKVIRDSEIIVCRAGYSSIMDMKVLGKKALLIPTPGQTEQEYLATHLSKSGIFEMVSQDEFTTSYLRKKIILL